MEKEKDLVRLKADRRLLQADFDRLQAAQVRLQEGEAAEADAVAAVNKLAEEEVEAVRQWASAGAVGPKPVVDLDAHRDANERLAVACAASIAIKAAATQIEADISAVCGKIADLDKRIEALAYQEMLAVFARMHADLRELSGQVRSRVAEAYSCHEWILAIARDLSGKDLHDRAREYYNLAGEMKTFAMPEFAPSSGDVAARVHTWQSRFSNFVRD